MNLLKKTDFDDKLKKINKKVTLNKTKHVVKIEEELTDLAKNQKKDMVLCYTVFILQAMMVIMF